MGKPEALLTVEERARIAELQDLLIDRFVAHREAVEDRRDDHARSLEIEIDGLLREKGTIEKWATVASA